MFGGNTLERDDRIIMKYCNSDFYFEEISEIICSTFFKKKCPDLLQLLY
jgi:hypothetical protein